MSKRKTGFVRHEIAEGMSVYLNDYGVNKIFRKIQAEREAWHDALGVTRGLSIPEKPLPESAEERQAELDAVTKEEMEVTQILIGPSRPPDGPECESLSRKMLDLRHRRWKLTVALRADR